MTVIRYHLPRFCFSIHARINLLRNAAENIQAAVVCWLQKPLDFGMDVW